jgi:hypothetical protein
MLGKRIQRDGCLTCRTISVVRTTPSMVEEVVGTHELSTLAHHGAEKTFLQDMAFQLHLFSLKSTSQGQGTRIFLGIEAHVHTVGAKTFGFGKRRRTIDDGGT